MGQAGNFLDLLFMLTVKNSSQERFKLNHTNINPETQNPLNSKNSSLIERSQTFIEASWDL